MATIPHTFTVKIIIQYFIYFREQFFLLVLFTFLPQLNICGICFVIYGDFCCNFLFDHYYSLKSTSVSQYVP